MAEDRGGLLSKGRKNEGFFLAGGGPGSGAEDDAVDGGKGGTEELGGC